MSYVPVLKKLYTEQVAPELVKARGYKNKHQVPKLVKINFNTGIDADADKNQIADIARYGPYRGPEAGSHAKSLAQGHRQFQAEAQGQIVGLQCDAPWQRRCGNFLYRLARGGAADAFATFRGVPSKLDGQGNYSLGYYRFLDFP
jgi:large subunit ribosomal protein L5